MSDPDWLWPVVAEMWRFLIGTTRSDVLSIPYVEHVDDLPASTPAGARYLVGFMLGAGDTRPRPRMSPMVRRDGGWSRGRLADQVGCIKHWRIVEGDYALSPDVEAMWFVDSPYQDRGEGQASGRQGSRALPARVR